MSDSAKLDLILDRLEDAQKARERQAEKLDGLALDTREHFVEDKAFMTETRAELSRMNVRVVALEAKRDAETTQKLKALDEPKDTWLQVKRGLFALLVGAPVTLLVGLLAAWFMHLLGWR